MAGVTLGAHGTYVSNAAATVVDGGWRIALGCVAAVPHRASAVEEKLSGADVDEATVRAAVDGLGATLDPPSDVHASADYRRSLAETSTVRAVMYLANKVQNIAGAADTLLELAGIEMDEIRPVAEAMEQGGRLAAKAQVTDALLDKCRPIAGTPADCIAAIEEYRDAGCTHVMLELWGEDRHEQIRLFGEQVLPHVRG